MWGLCDAFPDLFKQQCESSGQQVITAQRASLKSLSACSSGACLTGTMTAVHTSQAPYKLHMHSCGIALITYWVQQEVSKCKFRPLVHFVQGLPKTSKNAKSNKAAPASAQCVCMTNSLLFRQEQVVPSCLHRAAFTHGECNYSCTFSASSSGKLL